MTKQYEQPQTVSTDALATLGTIIDESCGRDAIHLAVENVIAYEDLKPGQHVSLHEGFARASGRTVGIVDPFLQADVKRGEHFWLVVYPRQITSLRHVWEHPAFPPSDADTARTQAAAPPLATMVSQRDLSLVWMTNWAMRHMGEDYYSDEPRSPERALDFAIEAGRSSSIGPYESARDYIDDTWWDHWEAITGEKSVHRGEYFSCSC